ncbi:MAG: hypothetical protein RSE10_04085, partial [Oscillospiraceae bacterium]
VVMDWNKPLAAFDGASAYETAVAAFAHHISQSDYFKVEQTGPYDCRMFGLYRSTVGEVENGNDFFENIRS